MKLTVNKYLNARIAEASVNAVCNFYKKPGDTLEIDNVITGSEIDGNAIWYHCKDDGCYYWSGGLVETEFELPSVALTKELLFAIIADIQKNFHDHFSKIIEGYTGCGIGYKNLNITNSLSLVFFVSLKKAAADVKRPAPDFIFHKGFKIITDVVQMKGKLQHYNPNPAPLNPDPDNHDPMPVGGKVFQKDLPGNYGTRTLKVLKDNTPMLLSCFHVMANSLYKNGKRSVSKSDNIKIEIPDQLSNGTIELDVIEGLYDGYVDYALARLPNPSLVSNFFNGQPINGFASKLDVAMLWQDNVDCIGKVSSFQQGMILYTSSHFDMDDGTTFRDIIITEKISTYGDSGAPVIKGDVFIGYVFAGDNTDYSFLIPSYKLGSLNCSL